MSQSTTLGGQLEFPNDGGGRRGRRRAPRVEIGQLFDKLPPHALEAEMALLGSMIIDANVIGDVIQIVKSPEDFHRAAHGAVFQALVELYDSHNAGDLTMLYNRLADRGVAEEIGGPEFLEELVNAVPVATNATHYARIVADKAIVRRLIGAAGEILRTAYTNAGDVREVLDSAEKAIFDVVQSGEKEGAASLSALLELTMQAIESRSQGGVLTGHATGFTEFDEMTSGLQRGDMIILAARPSMGKTAFALNMAENVALLGHPVGVFSLEMSKQALAQRLLCSRSEVDSHRLRRNMLSRDDFRRLGLAMAELNEAPIYIDDTPGISVLELRAKARRMVAKHDVELIIVDYLQLMSGSSRESRQQEVSEISRGVKGLARELNVPVICLSQLNRAAENREDHRPRMADLRESGSIEQDADVVLMLHREDYYQQHKDDYEPTNIAELIITKQRNGPTGTVKLVWVGESTKFKNYTPMPGSNYGGGGGEGSRPELSAPRPSSFGGAAHPAPSPVSNDPPANIDDIPI
ncbi:MAG: replicative DNA helicase [Phycisphaerales bacterium]